MKELENELKTGPIEKDYNSFVYSLAVLRAYLIIRGHDKSKIKKFLLKEIEKVLA